MPNKQTLQEITSQTIPLPDILEQCNQQGLSPTANFTAWKNCLQEVFTNQNFAYTASDFVSAINQVWTSQVDGPTMLNAVGGLTLENGSIAFTAAVIQPLIDALLATFLIRDNLNDSGGVSVPPYWISPDIICYQQNTLTFPNAQNNYSNDYLNMSFQNGQPNNFYIRAENITSTPASGYVALYAVPGGLLLTPQSWLPNEISAPSSSLNFFDSISSPTIQGGEMCLTTTPFSFSGFPGGGHYCLITVASGANGMPFPIPPSFSSNAEQALWVETNPNVSQRNLSFLPINGTVGTMAASLGNNNSTPTEFVISVTQEGDGNSFPSGTMISASITDSRAPFSPPSQTWTNTGVSFWGLTVPGNINGGPGNSLITITATITLPVGSSFVSTGSVVISYYQIPASTMDELEQKVTRFHEIPSFENPGTTETPSLILMGTCNFYSPAN